MKHGADESGFGICAQNFPSSDATPRNTLAMTQLMGANENAAHTGRQGSCPRNHEVVAERGGQPTASALAQPDRSLDPVRACRGGVPVGTCIRRPRCLAHALAGPDPMLEIAVPVAPGPARSLLPHHAFGTVPDQLRLPVYGGDRLALAPHTDGLWPYSRAVFLCRPDAWGSCLIRGHPPLDRRVDL